MNTFLKANVYAYKILTTHFFVTSILNPLGFWRTTLLSVDFKKWPIRTLLIKRSQL